MTFVSIKVTCSPVPVDTPDVLSQPHLGWASPPLSQVPIIHKFEPPPTSAVPSQLTLL